MKRFLLAALIPFLAACGSGKKGETVKLSPIIEKALNDETSRFYADFSKFPVEKRTLPDLQTAVRNRDRIQNGCVERFSADPRGSRRNGKRIAIPSDRVGKKNRTVLRIQTAVYGLVVSVSRRDRDFRKIVRT